MLTQHTHNTLTTNKLHTMHTPDTTHTHIHRVTSVRHKDLPYFGCMWVNDNSIVCAGFNYYPVLWSHDDAGKLTYINKLDSIEKKETGHMR